MKTVKQSMLFAFHSSKQSTCLGFCNPDEARYHLEKQERGEEKRAD